MTRALSSDLEIVQLYVLEQNEFAGLMAQVDNTLGRVSLENTLKHIFCSKLS